METPFLIGIFEIGSGPLSVMPIGTWSRGPEDATAEEIEPGPSEHLALQHLEPVDVALDRPRAPGERQAGDDSVLIAAEAGHEGVEVGKIVCLNVIHPLLLPASLFGANPAEHGGAIW